MNDALALAAGAYCSAIATDATTITILLRARWPYAEGSARMKPERTVARELLGTAVEQADAISSILGRLAESPQSGEPLRSLAATSRAELAELRSLVASGASSLDACAQALRQLALLDEQLACAAAVCADSCRAHADHIAVSEEVDLHKLRGRSAAARASALADRLGKLSSPAGASCPPS